MPSNKIIADFLQKSPLYSKVEIEKTYFHPDRFHELTFQFFCPNEGNLQTFMLMLEPDEAIKTANSTKSDRFHDFFDPYQEDHLIKFTHHFSGQCQFCKKYKVNFLLNIFSDGPIPNLSLYDGFQIVNTRGNGHQENTSTLPVHRLFIKKLASFLLSKSPLKKKYSTFFKTTIKIFTKNLLFVFHKALG